jgi:Zn-dependent M32 family carboxypeptidase
MPADPDTVLRRLTDRLAPLERDLHRALWAATTDARPETSAARQRAEEAWLAALGDPDLHPRPGKDQHAFCLDVDRAGDIRVLANLAPGEEWLDVLLHEVGHAVYDDHIDRSLPWVLGRPPQGLRRPEGRAAPDWASKIHLAVAPVYYQSYLLGELLASQLDRAVRGHAGGFIGRPEAGALLAERVFAPGATMPWRDLVTAATGSPLGPEAFLAGLDA